MKRSPSQHPHPRLTRGIAACTERTVGEPGVNEIVHLEERVPASSEPGLSIKEVADWQRIRIGKPQVLGVNEQYSGLLDVDVPLEPSPDVHWDALFERGAGVPISVSMHPPRLHGSTVRLRPPDSEVERYVDALRVRVEAVNDQYEREVLPALRGEAAATERAEAERTRRVEEAQERLDASE